MCAHEDVIEGITFGRFLKCDAINDVAREAARLRGRQHG